MELKRMMEKLGQAKTHLELKKMIAEVDTTNSGVFLNSMILIKKRPLPSDKCGKQLAWIIEWGWVSSGELRRSRRVLSAEADNALRDYLFKKKSLFKNKLKTCLPPSMLNLSSIVHAYWASLGDKGLFSSANILQIAKKNCVCILWIFIEYKLLTGPAIVRIFLGSYPSASKSSRKPMHRVWLEQRRFFVRSTIAPFADSWGLPDLICIIICSYTVLDIVNSKSHQHILTIAASRTCWNGPVSLP